MPKTTAYTKEDVQFLAQHHETMTYKALAQRIGCCVDTLKRILVRENITEFDGEKYQLPANHGLKTWQRPCMQCGSMEVRPKWQYRCDTCHNKYDNLETPFEEI